MGKVNDGDILRVAARARLPGSSDIVNVFHMISKEHNPVDDRLWVQRCAQYWKDVEGQLSLQRPIGYHAEDIEVYNVTQDRPMGTAIVDAGGIVPSADAEAGPVSGLITAITDTKRVRGKKFVAGLLESILDGGFWDSYAMPALMLWATKWLSGFHPDGEPLSWAIPVIWSKAKQCVAWILGLRVGNEPGIQRRRRISY